MFLGRMHRFTARDVDQLTALKSRLDRPSGLGQRHASLNSPSVPAHFRPETQLLKNPCNLRNLWLSLPPVFEGSALFQVDAVEHGQD